VPSNYLESWASAAGSKISLALQGKNFTTCSTLEQLSTARRLGISIGIQEPPVIQVLEGCLSKVVNLAEA
jgi:hypothetical protein